MTTLQRPAAETDPELGDPELGDPGLDNAAWNSLVGVHERFAERIGGAARYHPSVAPFVALDDVHNPQSWAELVSLVGPGNSVHLSGSDIRPPAGWTVDSTVAGLQFVAVGLQAESDAEAQPLGNSDVPEILDLVRRTRPGPFAPRTIELGNYLGIRREGALVAMAGERLQPAGWTEISAVCTDPAHRSQGLGTRLIAAVAAGIRERGDKVLLHTGAGNTTAIRLYESLGFRLRRKITFATLTAPTECQ